MAALILRIGLSIFLIGSTNAFSITRRQSLTGISTVLISSSPITNHGTAAAQAATPPPNVPLQTSSGGTVRVEEIGGGLDLISPPPLSASDVFYPNSMIGTEWRVQRVITSAEGDVGQAALAWRLLGGSSAEGAFVAPSKVSEVYTAEFIEAPDDMADARYDFDGQSLRAAISDRKRELSSRLALSDECIRWKAGEDSIEYSQRKSVDASAANLTIVRRKIEPPSDAGFGSDEVYRIESSAGGIFAGQNIYRAARVRRRYRRGFDEASGRRIIDCIEIVTTHRVLDGVAQIELPTSTCKSRLRFTQL